MATEKNTTEGINIQIPQVTFPSFNEFCKTRMNESVDAEMTLYSEIASRVDQLKEIYGEKAIGKTGMMKALMSMNELILTGTKESSTQTQTTQSTVQPQSMTQQPVQPQATTQAQDTTQPQTQTTTQPQDTTQAQSQTQAQK